MVSTVAWVLDKLLKVKWNTSHVGQGDWANSVNQSLKGYLASLNTISFVKMDTV